MQTKIQRWGNSLGLRIPKSFAEEVDVEAGSPVDISVEGGDLVIRPMGRQRYDLRSLLRGVTAENLHEVVETGDAVGQEGW